MKSGTVFAIATAFGLTFASAITALAQHGWTRTDGRYAVSSQYEPAQGKTAAK